MIEQRREANDVIQIMRGIAIIVVLIRHAIAQVNTDFVLNSIREIIICFHMPAFFVIAGYLFQKNIHKYISNGKIKFLLNKAKHLLLPYLFWTILLWVVVQVTCSLSPSISSQMAAIGFAPMSPKYLIYGLLTYQVYYTEHLWFLYVLFLLFVLNIVTSRIGGKTIGLAIWGVMGFATLWVNFPHIIERIMLWGIFFTAGRVISRVKGTRILVQPTSSWLCTITFLVCSVVRIGALQLSISGKSFAVFMQLDKYLLGFTGVALIYIIANKINTTSIGQALKYTGDYSFDIYLMHNPYFVALSAVILNQIINIPSYITVIISTILGVAAPIIASRFVVRRNKIMSFVMIGK